MSDYHRNMNRDSDLTSTCAWCGTSTGGCMLCRDNTNEETMNEPDTTLAAPTAAGPLPYTITQDSITVLIGGVPKSVPAGTPQYAQLRTALFALDWGAVADCLTREGALRRYLPSSFKVDGDKIFDHTGMELPADVAQKIVQMATSNEDASPLVAFYCRLANNPSRRSVTQLFSFLGHAGIPLEPDGTFLAYKGVREDFLDQHSGTLLNTPGTTQRMNRMRSL